MNVKDYRLGSYHFLPGRGPSFCGGTRISGVVKGGTSFFMVQPPLDSCKWPQISRNTRPWSNGYLPMTLIFNLVLLFLVYHTYPLKGMFSPNSQPFTPVIYSPLISLLSPHLLLLPNSHILEQVIIYDFMNLSSRLVWDFLNWGHQKMIKICTT